MSRRSVQEGCSAIPKSTKQTRIAENLNAIFELTSAELAVMDALDTGVRGGAEPASLTLKTADSPSRGLSPPERSGEWNTHGESDGHPHP